MISGGKIMEQTSFLQKKLLTKFLIKFSMLLLQ